MRKPSQSVARLQVQMLRWLPVLSLIFCWQWAGASSAKAHFFYSTPLEVISKLFYALTRGTILGDAAATLEEVLIGSVAGLLVGFALALALWWLRSLGEALEPIVIALASVPIFAVAPLLVFWFGVGFAGKVVVVGLSVVFLGLLSTYQAARNIDEEYRELAQCFGASRFDVFQRLVLRGSIILAAPSYRLAVIFGFTGAFIAELISSNKGLGHFIQVSSGLYDVAGILAGLIVFIVCVLCCILVLDWINKHFESWR
jgi:NitT/TauT family transport system permease protein